MAESVASKLLIQERPMDRDPLVCLPHQPPDPMVRDLQTRFFAVFLALLSVAAIAFAWINFQKERETLTAYDGVWWVEDGGHLRAQRVDADGTGLGFGRKPITPWCGRGSR